MKTTKKLLSFVLALCMILPLIPFQRANAASEAKYTLETGEIDLNAKYLIVSNGYALSGTTAGGAVPVTIENGNTITSSELEDCCWVFDQFSDNVMSVHHNGAYLYVKDYYSDLPAYSTEAKSLSYNKGDGEKGEYVVYFKGSYYYHILGYNSYYAKFYASLNSTLWTGAPKFQFYKLEEATNYNITHDTNGAGTIEGFLPTGVTTLAAGETYTIPQIAGTVIRKNGDLTYEFTHWTDDAAGNGNKYYPGNTFEVNKNLTLYAQWKQICVVSYNKNGAGTIAGLLPTGTTTLPEGETYTIPQLNGTVTRQDGASAYEFTHWTDDAAGNGKKYYPGGTFEVDGNLTLYAQWKQIVVDESLKTKCTIRHLMKGTYEVLSDDVTIDGASVGSQIYAEQNSLKFDEFSYCGATINGVYHSKEQKPYLTLVKDASHNVIIIHYLPDPDLHLSKEATLEDNGTYTIQMEMFTHDNPVTTIMDESLPLDIVMVLDQSSSMWTSGVYGDLQNSVKEFIDLVVDHGRSSKIDHRIAVVGYGNDGGYGATGTGPIAGSYNSATGTTTKYSGYWTNTGVFDVHGDFHAYPITGFNYEVYNGNVDTNGTYYAYSQTHNEYLLLDYHEVYRHLITKDEAYVQLLKGEKIYGYVEGEFLEISRNTNGMWVYDDVKGDKQLYSSTEFFTWHEKVWTHRHGTEPREIHAYMVDGVFTSVDGHDSLFTRKETTQANPDKNIYKDALIPVTMGSQGSGYVDPCFDRIVNGLGAKGETFVSKGMEMANSVLEANPLTQEDVEAGRRRVVIVFTDGKPGDSSHFDEVESNAAIYQSSISAGTYGAEVYTIGIYGKEIVSVESDQDYFMNGLSSNYPDAETLEDVWNGIIYIPTQAGFNLDKGGPYYAKVGEKCYLIKKSITHVEGEKYSYKWLYTDSTGKDVVIHEVYSNTPPVITAVDVDGVIKNQVNGVDIYRKSGDGYKEAASDKYYKSTNDPSDLEQYFATILRDLTTHLSEKIWLNNDAILRDIMGQGLVLTPGSEITVYYEEGTFIADEKRVEWSGERVYMDSLVIPANSSGTLTSNLGIYVDGKFLPYISVYNLNSPNPTDPNGANYNPHTVDVLGYEYSNEEWYLNAESPNGRRLIATITRVEARDNVAWGESQSTNNEKSGLWLRENNGERYLLEVFNQPSTVFVERAYVVDYGKEFELTGWYFDSEDGNKAEAIHVDCEIENGMNWFNENSPTEKNGENYGNIQYGNIRIENDKVYYQPTTTQWGGYDQFYVFGNTWRNTVKTQSANENGNLWNKVTVIPANNIYYEDSFVVGKGNGVNDVSGFVFTGDWEIAYSDGKTNAGQNQEHPEQVEGSEFGGVHGWTDGLADDKGFSDGQAHLTGANGGMGAKVQFSFTGTGVDVYTRTNEKSGMIVATLRSVSGTSAPVVKSLAMDNLAKSGDYYQIPTVSFENLEYGTYEVTLIATAASAAATGSMRYEYYLDGIRVYNPLGVVTNDTDVTDKVVKDAYGKELNAVNTEIRDIILDYDAFYPDRADIGATGAVFIDWIQEGQGTNGDGVGTGMYTYEIGTTYKTYGPKNEVYLAPGQAIVLMVDPKNNYYVGMKSLDGRTVKVGVSGQEAKTISISHTIDMYYEVAPSMTVKEGEGYITIQNLSENGALLALTKLRTTNLTENVTSHGILPIMAQYAIQAVEQFALDLEAAKNKPEEAPKVEEPDAFEMQQQQIKQLFATVSDWLGK